MEPHSEKMLGENRFLVSQCQRKLLEAVVPTYTFLEM